MKYTMVALLLALLVTVQSTPAATENNAVRCSEEARPAGHAYSAQELAAQLVKPTRIQDLLHNLKVAFSKGLFLQPAFYDDAILKQFFADARITTEAWSGNARRQEQHIRVSGVGAFQGMTVKLKRTCFLTHSGQSERTFFTGGASFNTSALSGLTVGLVRSTFGDETQAWPDAGLDTDAVHTVPSSKGQLIYVLPGGATSGLMPGTNRLSFTIRLDPMTGTIAAPLTLPFPDTDLIQTVDIIQLER